MKTSNVETIMGMPPMTFIVVLFGIVILIAILFMPFAAKSDKKRKAKRLSEEAEKKKSGAGDGDGGGVSLIKASSSSVTTCPDCGGMVSKNADTCPHCGRVFKKQTVQTGGTSGLGVFIAIVLAVIFLIWFLPKILTVELTFTPIVGK